MPKRDRQQKATQRQRQRQRERMQPPRFNDEMPSNRKPKRGRKMLDVHPRQDFLLARVLGQPAPHEHVAEFLLPKGWSGTGRLPNEGGSSPNQIKLSRSCALAEAALGSGVRVDGAIAINESFYRDMRDAGHWCFPRGGNNDGGVAIEFGGGSHSHIWLNAETVDWLCCLKLGLRAHYLCSLVERDLRIQSALMYQCRYVATDGKLRFIVPGARTEKQRGGGPHAPDYQDDCRDRWGRWIMEGDRKVPRRVDAYYTALHALREAEKLGGQVGALMGSDIDMLVPDVARFGYDVERHDDGRGFIAWVETLGRPGDLVLNPAYLVRVEGGVPSFEFTRQEPI